jgi:hypothetical protein
MVTRKTKFGSTTRCPRDVSGRAGSCPGNLPRPAFQSKRNRDRAQTVSGPPTRRCSPNHEEEAQTRKQQEPGAGFRYGARGGWTRVGIRVWRQRRDRFGAIGAWRRGSSSTSRRHDREGNRRSAQVCLTIQNSPQERMIVLEPTRVRLPAVEVIGVECRVCQNLAEKGVMVVELLGISQPNVGHLLVKSLVVGDPSFTLWRGFPVPHDDRPTPYRGRQKNHTDQNHPAESVFHGLRLRGQEQQATRLGETPRGRRTRTR